MGEFKHEIWLTAIKQTLYNNTNNQIAQKQYIWQDIVHVQYNKGPLLKGSGLGESNLCNLKCTHIIGLDSNVY